MELSKQDLNKLISEMETLLWAPREIRQEVQRRGLDVIPVNFYSGIASIDDVEASYEYADSAPYLNEDLFNAKLMEKWLIDLTTYASEFSPATKGDEKTVDDGFFWENSQYSYSDAMSYYAFLRRLKPSKVVEIGSGFSTLIAIEALKVNGSGAITCIEPYPRDFLREIKGVDLLQVKAQDINPSKINDMLGDGDVLFIDSTHTVKTGSDCLHIYLRLLPAIKSNIFVCIHDIFLPFGVPKHWITDHRLHWTEQYLVLAWMIDNPRISVLYGSAYHERFNSDLLAQFMHGRYPHGGGSLWLEYRRPGFVSGLSNE